MVGLFQLERWHLGPALIVRLGAARGEGAAGRQIVQCRYHAADFPQPLIGGHVQPTGAANPGDGAQQAAWIGVQWVREQVLDRGFLDLAAGIHHHDPLGGLGNNAEVVGNQYHGGAEFPLKISDQVEDLRLDRHVQGGGGFVRDQHLGLAGQRHGDHRPLAHAAGHLMRILFSAPLRFGNTHVVQHLHRSGAGSGLRQAIVQHDHFRNLLANGHQWVERGHRFLKDHRDLAAAHLPHLGLAKAKQVGAVELDAARHDLPRRLRDQAHERQGGDGLAAAGLADDCQGFTSFDTERNVLHRLNQPAAGVEDRGEAGDFENGSHQSRCLGSRASRKASPKRLEPNTTRLMARPG